MTLDAQVACDCVEKGDLIKPHPYPELLFIGEDGGPDIRSDDPYECNEHLNWLFSSPCRHGNCTLVDHFIGNISLVAALRGILSTLSGNPEQEYPILRTKFIYNGMHCGDYLSVEEVRQLKTEIEKLRLLDVSYLQQDETLYWKDFLSKVEDLIVASLLINKPIVF